ncbi:MAG TPA: peptide chain release factor N(5)-glutamine methyltransferase, partial [Rhizomicrobium sp.]|nr:peptide chain release factor N(5)-glutamine methyltransferase [Rhizomicrobium sp.]
VSAAAEAGFEALIARRAARAPVAYLTGEKEFWSLSFAVGPGVLIPRPETETVIEQALKLFADPQAPLNILDLGTGSGILLLTLLHLYPAARGVGVDASEQALAWAGRNRARHHLESRATLIRSDWDADWEEGLPETFDLVVSNPPYVARDAMAQLEPELTFEPQSALEAGPDGLAAYRALGPVLCRRLAPGAPVLLEIGADQNVTVPEVLSRAGLDVLGVFPDLSGLPRVVLAKNPLETGR